jgi:hypothetical protein
MIRHISAHRQPDAQQAHLYRSQPCAPAFT